MVDREFENRASLLLTLPVVDVLSWYGKRVDHRGYMYYSPFREEAEPSMRVTVCSDGTWLWADYGGSPSPGKKVDGGGCLELVRRLGGFSGKAAAMRELERIAASRGMVFSEDAPRPRRSRTVTPAEIIIDDVSVGFSTRRLVNYSERERGIGEALLSRYCRQVTYHTMKNSQSRYTVIGFPNNAGGWVLRGTGDPSRSKRNSVSAISTFTPDGVHRPDGVVGSGKCLLFEGFMDYLSFLAWSGLTAPGVDVCVLNSTSMLGSAKDWVLRHGEVRSFFDADQAGERATRELAEWCKAAGKGFRDGRGMLGGHKDINEAWVARLESRMTCGMEPRNGRGLAK